VFIIPTNLQRFQHSNAFFALRNQPHLLGHKYVIVRIKQRSVNKKLVKVFFSITEWLIYGTICQFVQTSLSRFSRSLSNDYLLKYCKANFTQYSDTVLCCIAILLYAATGALKIQDLKMKDQISGPENAGPSRNAASLGSKIQRAARTPRLRPPGQPSPSLPLQTLLIAVKSACFYRVKVWLWCRAGILASVAVAQTLSHPWTVLARYAAHAFAWCCVCTAKCTLSGQ